MSPPFAILFFTFILFLVTQGWVAPSTPPPASARCRGDPRRTRMLVSHSGSENQEDEEASSPAPPASMLPTDERQIALMKKLNYRWDKTRRKWVRGMEPPKQKLEARSGGRSARFIVPESASEATGAEQAPRKSYLPPESASRALERFEEIIQAASEDLRRGAAFERSRGWNSEAKLLLSRPEAASAWLAAQAAAFLGLFVASASVSAAASTRPLGAGFQELVESFSVAPFLLGGPPVLLLNVLVFGRALAGVDRWSWSALEGREPASGAVERMLADTMLGSHALPAPWEWRMASSPTTTATPSADDSGDEEGGVGGRRKRTKTSSDSVRWRLAAGIGEAVSAVNKALVFHGLLQVPLRAWFDETTRGFAAMGGLRAVPMDAFERSLLRDAATPYYEHHNELLASPAMPTVGLDHGVDTAVIAGGLTMVFLSAGAACAAALVAWCTEASIRDSSPDSKQAPGFEPLQGAAATASFMLWWAGVEHAFRASPFLRAECEAAERAGRGADAYFAMTTASREPRPSTASVDTTTAADVADADAADWERSSVSSEAAAAAKALRGLASAWTAKFGGDWHGNRRPGTAVGETTGHGGGEARHALLEYVEASATSAALSATLFEATYYISEEGGGLLWAPILASWIVVLDRYWRCDGERCRVSVALPIDSSGGGGSSSSSCVVTEKSPQNTVKSAHHENREWNWKDTMETKLMRAMLEWFKSSSLVTAKHQDHVRGPTAQHLFKGSPFATRSDDAAKLAFIASPAGELVEKFMAFERREASEWKKSLVDEAAFGIDADPHEVEEARALARADLDALVASAPVVLFSFVDCPWCVAAKQLLAEELRTLATRRLDDAPVQNGDTDSEKKQASVADPTSPRVVEIDELGSRGKLLRAALADTTGRTSMPSCFIGGCFVGGFTDGEPAGEPGGLRSLARSGQLSSLLQSAIATDHSSGSSNSVSLQGLPPPPHWAPPLIKEGGASVSRGDLGSTSALGAAKCESTMPPERAPRRRYRRTGRRRGTILRARNGGGGEEEEEEEKDDDGSSSIDNNNHRKFEDFFRRRPGDPKYIEFGGRVFLDDRVPDAANPAEPLKGAQVPAAALAAYLSQPDRVLQSAWDPAMTFPLGDDASATEKSGGNTAADAAPCSKYRLQLQELNFAVLRVQNYVDVLVTCRAGGAVQIKSLDMQTTVRLRSSSDLEPPKKVEVSLDLSGTIRAQLSSPSSDKHSGDVSFDAPGRIIGDCGFQAGGKLIRPLRLLPDRILRPAASVVNKRILAYAETVFLSGMKTAFWEWYDDEQRAIYPPLPRQE